MTHRAIRVVVVLFLAACTTPLAEPDATDGIATSTTASATTTEPGGTSNAQPPTVSARVVDIPGAVSLNVASNGTHVPVVAWVEQQSVSVAYFDPLTAGLGRKISVHGDQPPFAHPIERPALGIDPDGTIHVAYTSGDGLSGSVVYRTWDGEMLGGPGVISGDPRPETVLVHLTLDGFKPVFSWLEDSTLSVATTLEGGIVENELVDDLTCDCCNPVPLILDDALLIAYRDQTRDGGDVIRDVVVVRSEDRGSSFGAPVLVPDDHWHIDACPFTGPSIVARGDELVIAWMDARQSLHPEQRSTTIWVDRSSDGGRNFGTDLSITHGGIHRWPMLARDDGGVIHLVWETQGSHGGISYSRSVDDGRSFTLPRLLVPSGDAGSAAAPSVVAHGESLILSWTDRTGGHVAAFRLADLGS